MTDRKNIRVPLLTREGLGEGCIHDNKRRMGYSKYNTFNLRETRKELRNKQTKPEEFFWNKVRAKQFHGLKFRRQHSIGRYVLDFYCNELKLCIEIDGYSHAEQIEYDEIRTDFLEANGIRVVRYNNEDIMNNIEAVMNDLVVKISQEGFENL